MLKRIVSTLLPGLLASATLFAQEFPSQPIRIVIPYAPGGGSDILARPIAPLMSERLKQSVLIDNKGGAAGNIGAQLVARAPADGHTLLMANNSHTINPFLYSNAGYDLAGEFAPISLVATSPVIVVVHKTVNARTLSELVALAHREPGKLNFGSPGAGTPGHLAAVLFLRQAKMNAVHVAYKGSGPTTMALLQGEVQFSFSTPAAVEQHVKSGELRALAVTSRERFGAFPAVPTVAESGLAGLSDYTMEIWWGLLAPVATSERVLNQLHTAVTEAIRDPQVQRRWITQGMVPRPTTRAEFAAIIRADLQKWKTVIQESGVKAE